MKERVEKTVNQHILKVSIGDRKYAWVLVTAERTLAHFERVGDAEMVSDCLEIKATSLVHYREAKPGCAIMEMCGNTIAGQCIDFSDGFIVVNEPWRGLRIGTYLMNYLVSWARENYPGYIAAGIRLGSIQANTETAKEIRNRFYDRFGFKFVWADDDHKEGILVGDLRVSDLNTTDKWMEKIERFELANALQEIFRDASIALIEYENVKRGAECIASDRDRLRSQVQQSNWKRRIAAGWAFVAGIVVAFVFMKAHNVTI